MKPIIFKNYFAKKPFTWKINKNGKLIKIRNPKPNQVSIQLPTRKYHAFIKNATKLYLDYIRGGDVTYLFNLVGENTDDSIIDIVNALYSVKSVKHLAMIFTRKTSYEIKKPSNIEAKRLFNRARTFQTRKHLRNLYKHLCSEHGRDYSNDAFMHSIGKTPRWTRQKLKSLFQEILAQVEGIKYTKQQIDEFWDNIPQPHQEQAMPFLDYILSGIQAQIKDYGIKIASAIFIVPAVSSLISTITGLILLIKGQQKLIGAINVVSGFTSLVYMLCCVCYGPDYLASTIPQYKDKLVEFITNCFKKFFPEIKEHEEEHTQKVSEHVTELIQMKQVPEEVVDRLIFATAHDHQNAYQTYDGSDYDDLFYDSLSTVDSEHPEEKEEPEYPEEEEEEEDPRYSEDHPKYYSLDGSDNEKFSWDTKARKTLFKTKEFFPAPGFTYLYFCKDYPGVFFTKFGDKKKYCYDILVKNQQTEPYECEHEDQTTYHCLGCTEPFLSCEHCMTDEGHFHFNCPKPVFGSVKLNEGITITDHEAACMREALHLHAAKLEADWTDILDCAVFPEDYYVVDLDIKQVIPILSRFPGTPDTMKYLRNIRDNPTKFHTMKTTKSYTERDFQRRLVSKSPKQESLNIFYNRNNIPVRQPTKDELQEMGLIFPSQVPPSKAKKFLDINLHEDQSEDVVKLGLLGAGVILTGCFSILGGKTMKGSSDFFNLLRNTSGAALSIGTIYGLVNRLFIDDTSTRIADIGTDLSDLHAQLIELQTIEASHIANSELPDLWETMQSKYLALERLVRMENHPGLSDHFKSTSVLYNKVGERVRELIATILGTQARVEPTMHIIYGPFNQGKSTFISSEMRAIVCKLLGTSTKDGVIELTGDLKYFPAFNGKSVAIIDEFHQTAPDEKHVLMMNGIISSTPFKSDGASIQLKEQYFTAQMILAGSNRGRFAINCPKVPKQTEDAYWSRYTFIYFIREGQHVGNKRGLTENSYPRFFLNNGHTPTVDEEKALKKDGFWKVPNPLPAWMGKELTLAEYAQLTAQQLVDKQHEFLTRAKTAQQLEDSLPDHISLVTRYQLPLEWAKTVPEKSIFRSEHPMFGRVVSALEELAPGFKEKMGDEARKPPTNMTPLLRTPNITEINAALSKLGKWRTQRHAPQMGSYPLVIHILGKSAVGKSYASNTWALELAKVLNLHYFNSKGTIPDKAQPHTIYVLDDVYPTCHAEYCQFWEKCSGDNIIFLTSNTKVPPIISKMWSATINPFRWMSNPIESHASLTTTFRDYSEFPTEACIRRVGYAGPIFYKNNYYHIDQEPTVFIMQTRGELTDAFTMKRTNPAYSIDMLHHIIAEHLGRTEEVLWKETTENAPSSEWDVDITFVKEHLHTVTDRDFYNSAIGNDHSKVKVIVVKPELWKNQAAFAFHDLIPKVMPKYEDLSARRNAFSPLIQSLRQQKDNMLVRVSIGDFQLYTQADDPHLYIKGETTSPITLIDDSDRARVIFRADEGDFTLQYKEIAALLMAEPNHEVRVDYKTKIKVKSCEEQLKNIPSIHALMEQIELGRRYMKIKSEKGKLSAQFDVFLRTHPYISFILGAILFVGTAYATYKVFNAFTSSQGCVDRKCDKVHLLIKEENQINHHHEESKELELGAVFSVLGKPEELKKNIPHYNDHNHDQKLLGKRQLHSHDCLLCQKPFFHRHVIRTKEESEQFQHFCHTCRKTIGIIEHSEEGKMYKKKYYDPTKKGEAQAKDYGPEDERKQRKNRPFVEIPSKWDEPVFKVTKNPDYDTNYVYCGDWADEVENFYIVEQGLQRIDFVTFEEHEEQSIYQSGLNPISQHDDPIKRKIYGNLGVVSVAKMGVTGLVIAGNIGVTVGHVFFDQHEKGVFTTDEDGTRNCTLLKKIPERDLAFFKIETKRTYPDISRYFASSYDAMSISQVQVSLVRGDIIHTSLAAAKAKLEFQYYVGDETIVKQKRIVTRFHGLTAPPTLAGDCGMPYFSAHKCHAQTPIVGIHATGSQIAPQTSGCIVSKEDILPILLAHKEEGLTQVHEVKIEALENPLIPVSLVADDWTYGKLLELKPAGNVLGKEKKYFVLGHNSTLYMPAGTKRVGHQRTPWSPKALDYGIPDNSIPAIQNHRFLPEAVVMELLRNPKGEPSIVLTRIAAANATLGVRLPPALRKTTREELINFYYPAVEAADGLRFLDIFELINGVRNPVDGLSGLTTVNTDASAGIYYNKKFNVQLKGELFEEVEGQEFHMTFAKTTAGLDLKNRFEEAVNLAKEGKTLIDMSNVKLKDELRPTAKALQGKTRAYESEGILSYLILKKFIGSFVQSFIVNRDMLHHTGGMNPQTEFSKHYQRLSRFPYLSGRDHSNFDKTVNEHLMEDVYQIIKGIFLRAKSEGHYKHYTKEQLSNIAAAVMGYICYSIESAEGTIFCTRGGVNSGVLVTNWLDSMIIDLTQIYATKLLANRCVDVLDLKEHEFIGGYPTLRSIHRHSDWITNGDDNLASYSHDFSRFMIFTNVQKVLEHYFGMICTPSSKDDKIMEFSTWEEETFCSRKFVGEYPFITGALKKISIFQQLHWWKTRDPKEYFDEICYNLMPEVMRWQDRAFYEEFSSIVMKLAREENVTLEMISYDQSIMAEKEALGLAIRLGESTHSCMKILKSEQQKNIISVIERMAFKCDLCSTICTSNVALWKHKGNSHPAQVTSTEVVCPYCDLDFTMESFRNHDHPGTKCLVGLCSAQPKDLVRMAHHAACHSVTFKECYGLSNIHPHSEQGKTSDSWERLGKALLRAHVEFAKQFMDGETEIIIIGKADGLKDTHLEIKGRKFFVKTDEDSIYFLSSSIEKHNPTEQELDEWCEYLSDEFPLLSFVKIDKDTVAIRKNIHEEQGDVMQMNTGMVGPAPDANAVALSGQAAVTGALALPIVHAPAYMIDGTNTVTQQMEMNNYAVSPNNMLISGRDDTLYDQAFSNKHFLKSFNMTSSNVAGTLLASVAYGQEFGANFFWQWIIQHSRFSGAIDYIVQVVGNATFSGSMAVGIWQKQTEDQEPPAYRSPEFTAINWEEIGVNTVFNRTYTMNHNVIGNGLRLWWDPLENDVSAGRNHLLFYVGTPLVNPHAEGEFSLTCNVWIRPGLDFKCIIPVHRPILTLGSSRSYSGPSIRLSEIMGPKGFISTDIPNPQIFQNRKSDYTDRFEFEYIPVGYQGVIDNSVAYPSIATAEPAVWWGVRESVSIPPTKGQSNCTTDLLRPSYNTPGYVATNENWRSSGKTINKVVCYTNGRRPTQAGYQRLDMLGLGATRYSWDLDMDYREHLEEIVAGWVAESLSAPEQVYLIHSQSLHQEFKYSWNYSRPTGDEYVNVSGAFQQADSNVASALGQLPLIRSFVPPPANHVIGSRGFGTSSWGGDYAVALIFTKRPPPTVSATIGESEMSSFTDQFSYDVIEAVRNILGGQTGSFQLVDESVNRTICSMVYDAPTGIIYAARKGNLDKQLICKKTDMRDLVFRNFLRLDIGATPPPLATDYFQTRKLNVTREWTQKQLQAYNNMLEGKPLFDLPNLKPHSPLDRLTDDLFEEWDEIQPHEEQGLTFDETKELQRRDLLTRLMNNQVDAGTSRMNQMDRSKTDVLTTAITTGAQRANARKAADAAKFGATTAANASTTNAMVHKEAVKDAAVIQAEASKANTGTRAEVEQYTSDQKNYNDAMMKQAELETSTRNKEKELASHEKIETTKIDTARQMQDTNLLHSKKMAREKMIHEDNMQDKPQSRGSLFKGFSGNGSPAGNFINGGGMAAAGAMGLAGGIGGMILGVQQMKNEKRMFNATAQNDMRMQQNNHTQQKNMAMMNHQIATAGGQMALGNMSSGYGRVQIQGMQDANYGAQTVA